MAGRVSKWVFRGARGLVQLFYRRPTLEGVENLPNGPCVIVGNHAQIHGPIVAELFIPGERVIWCNSEMMTFREVPDYAYRDFWSQKPLAVRWFFRLLSYVIAPLSVSIFTNAGCVPVYRDTRIMTTFRETLKHLSRNERVIIFPERDPPHNEIIYAFQDRFIDLGYMYRRQTGQPLAFVPMYIAPALNKVVLGKPLYCDGDARPDEARAQLCRDLMAEITRLARSLPRHRVVPYRNMPKRDYPVSLSEEVSAQ